MSTTHTQSKTEEEQGETEDLREKIAELEARIDDAVYLAKRSQQEASDLREELEKKDQRIDELESEVEALRDRDKLLQHVHKKSASSVDERAAILIRKLNNEAIAKQEDGREGTASFTISDARTALRRDNIDVQREKLYYTFEKAEDLVDNEDVLDYKKEPRTAEKNSRLRLDLEAGDLPAMVGGFQINPSDETEEGR